MRKYDSIPLNDSVLFKQKLLNWSQQFDQVCYLDSSGMEKRKDEQLYTEHQTLIGIGSISEISKVESGAFNQLKEFSEQHKDWIFGFLTYDLKNQVEKLNSNNFDGIKLPIMHFFVPEIVFIFQEYELKIGIHSDSKLSKERIIKEIDRQELSSESVSKTKVTARINKEDYISKVEKLKYHIQRGDIYEANFCQEFYSENSEINPLQTYLALQSVSPTPFSCFYKLKNKYLLSASPERFLKKEGEKIISQPIKGTCKRGKTEEEDLLLKANLIKDPKERSENVMIVDLVRNDLSNTAKKGTVKVEELCGIYSYKQVHQMVSTICSELDEQYHFTDCIKAAYPMGSMTGAPKLRAMELIEELETTKRGLFSGSVGYITPEQDFDFNVIIRSILYNKENNYLSFMVGSAITHLSSPEQEYEECLLKAKAIRKVLG